MNTSSIYYHHIILLVFAVWCVVDCKGKAFKFCRKFDSCKKILVQEMLIASIVALQVEDN